jgi:uncharacterized protein YbcC (UPF0753/DUF2309 family)
MVTDTLAPAPSAPDRAGDHIRHLVHEASEPVAQFWPMKRFVHHNPIHGLEGLPFDRAVREARHLIGGRGYLSNREYRQLYRSGRITAASLTRAIESVGPSRAGAARVTAGDWQIEAGEVWRGHLLFGFDALERVLLPWTLGAGGALHRWQDDLPEESRRRILDEWTSRAGSGKPATVQTYVAELWEAILQAATLAPESTARPGSESTEPETVALPGGRTVADWLEALAQTPVVEPINSQMIKWVSAFVDEGMAGWAMPGRHAGLYRAWRDLAPFDWSGRFAGIDDFASKVRRLPDTPEAAIDLSLRRLAVPEARWTEYLSRHLAQLPGWAGLVRWLGENPAYPYQEGHPADAVQYLAIRLFYEVELAQAICQRLWRVDGTVPALVAYWGARLDQYRGLTGARASVNDDETRNIGERAWPLFRLAQFTALMPDSARELTAGSVRTLLDWLAAFPEEHHGPVWLEAYEDTYRLALVGSLTAHRAANPGQAVEGDTRPRAQIVFCIDVRSESFRRHVEAKGYETYGYAGFFGIPMNHEAFDGAERFPLCPVLLTPKHAVDETVRPDERRQLQSYASGTGWLGLGRHLFHDLKQHPLSSLVLVDVLGFSFAAGLVGKTLAPAWHQSVVDTVRAWFKPTVRTRIDVDGSDASASGAGPLGFTIDEQAAMVEGGLRMIGLVGRFGRFVVLCGHGSVTDNNPYFSALHCGACGGKHGDANARAFAAMANSLDVRRLLAARGLAIPEDTWFLAAKHITTSDRVEVYDLDDVPPGHREDLRALRGDLESAGAAQAQERCGRLPRAPRGSPARAYRHVGVRTMDWANTRPEWGLAGNAAFIIGRRSMTRALSLHGRAFLHSYNPDHDPEGAILERIMMAPLVVGQWINMEHYFSAVDPWFWGSGSKVIHNVVSGVGVMLGSQSDLQTGLPVQTVNDGAAHYHEPLRLLAVIEAPPSRIVPIIARQALMQGLLHNGWLNLVAVDPATFDIQRYRPDGTWEPLRPASGAGAGGVQP